ncbi:MAG: metal ABC transporter substrate-binding protein [Chitinispirillales bacterium]|jgi:zinc transport system substrate-binding protein|nr:metal ABC transporter substrate-binding protein [Chitinispirillales bacterium]
MEIKNAFFFSLVFAVLNFGCGKNIGDKNNDKIIAASFYPMYIAALNITEDIPGIRLVNMAAPASGCLHDYQLTTADAALLEKASLLIVNGSGMESFLDKAVSLNKKLMLIDASEEIEFISRCDHNHDHNHRSHDNHNNDNDANINTHVWLSIENYMQQVKTIAAHLCAWDSVNADGYTRNSQNFIAELEELKEKAMRELSDLPNKKIAIFHDGFVYFAREFGLTVSAVIEREPGAEPSAAEVISIIRTIKNSGAKALFVEPHYNSTSVKTISAETGLPVFTLDPVLSGPLNKNSYIAAIEKNIEILKEALQ